MLIWVLMLTDSVPGIWQDWLNALPYYRATHEAFERLSTPRSAKVTSGIRVGTPALISRGFGVNEMEMVGTLIGRILRSPDDEAELATILSEVHALTEGFPVPGIALNNGWLEGGIERQRGTM